MNMRRTETKWRNEKLILKKKCIYRFCSFCFLKLTEQVFASHQIIANFLHVFGASYCFKAKKNENDEKSVPATRMTRENPSLYEPESMKILKQIFSNSKEQVFHLVERTKSSIYQQNATYS